jgi:hypothetical protein
MKQLLLKVFVVLSGGLMLYGCGKHTGDKQREIADGFNEDLIESVDEWVVFKSREFSLSFPPIFTVDTSGYRNTRLILSTELTDDGDKYIDNIAVLIKERENNLSLESYGEQCKKDILHYTESPEIISSGLKEKDGLDYFEIIYSETLTTFRLVREQRILFAGKQLYSITLTCEDAVFDQCREVGEAIMSTLTIH